MKQTKTICKQVGMNRNIGKYGNKFTSENQPPNRGRKPRLYTLAKKGYNIGKEEFYDVLMYLMQLPRPDLKDIAESEKHPVWVVNIARAIFKDTGKGVIYTVRELMDRLYGKVASNIDLTSGGAPFSHEPISIEIIDRREQVAKQDANDTDDTGIRGD